MALQMFHVVWWWWCVLLCHSGVYDWWMICAGSLYASQAAEISYPSFSMQPIGYHVRLKLCVPKLCSRGVVLSGSVCYWVSMSIILLHFPFYNLKKVVAYGKFNFTKLITRDSGGVLTQFCLQKNTFVQWNYAIIVIGGEKFTSMVLKIWKKNGLVMIN